MITRDTIRDWLSEGLEDGAIYMMVYYDTYDFTDYPVYVRTIEEFWRKYDSPLLQISNMQRLMEVYDLSMDIDEQLDERRAFHIPNRL